MKISLGHLRTFTAALLSKMPLTGQRRDSLMTQMRRMRNPNSNSARIEQLAQEIVNYRVMMDIDGHILTNVPEIETRFGESRRIYKKHSACCKLRELQSVPNSRADGHYVPENRLIDHDGKSVLRRDGD